MALTGCYLKNVKYVLYKDTKQTISEKVNSQKGNSPDHKIKFHNITKEKTIYCLTQKVGLEAAIL